MAATSIQARLAHSQWALKPQDLAVALKLVCLAGHWPGYVELARAMRLSTFEAHACMTRLAAARLLTDVAGSPALVMPAFRPLLLQGAPYFFPAVRGEVTVGFPTAQAVEPLKSMLVLAVDDLPPVWPHEDGTTRGSTLLPLYPKLPLAAVEHAPLYELLALFDGLRMGQARERELARSVLDARLKKVVAP